MVFKHNFGKICVHIYLFLDLGDICSIFNSRNNAYFSVRVIRNKSAYFASELHRSMKGLGTDDNTLVRIVASRCEVDMVQIKEEFQKAYKQTLGMFIKVRMFALFNNHI